MTGNLLRFTLDSIQPKPQGMSLSRRNYLLTLDVSGGALQASADAGPFAVPTRRIVSMVSIFTGEVYVS
jgi:hypothetical protein